MSLTSYRAAPPRAGKKTALAFGLGGFCIDSLEDLAATYSPVP
jgi:hypothetical protein